MDDGQGVRVTGVYCDYNINIEVLHIDDVYEYIDPELTEMLQSRINAALKLS